ncbi:class I SAM-dependent methyltransferase [Oenococcus sp. UCMA 16435]|nr:class I SAM-dependent methyltransferase [Oenococcus sp. UCMA 16435]MDI4583522.1 methyltransferase [Oenococcus sp. UCMA 14587]MDN6967717.1 class I SAM-dependent methyltransferase [Oenococcus sp. UCMA 17063]
MNKKYEQYFVSQPTSAHDLHTINFNFAGKELLFKTDAGVFSKSRVDFGTNVLLETIYTHFYELPRGKILDLGTGYGPVGIALKALDKDLDIDMVDINQRSLNLAKSNLELNDFSANVFQSDIYENIHENYAAIVVNPPIRAGKTVVTKMLVESKKHLIDGGIILAVLQKKQGAPSAEKNLENTFGNVEILKRDKGYYVLRSSND